MQRRGTGRDHDTVYFPALGTSIVRLPHSEKSVTLLRASVVVFRSNSQDSAQLNPGGRIAPRIRADWNRQLQHQAVEVRMKAGPDGVPYSKQD